MRRTGHQFDSFINEALYGISMASLSFISQNVGAKNMQRVKKTIYVTVMLTLITAGLIASVILPLAPVNNLKKKFELENQEG